MPNQPNNHLVNLIYEYADEMFRFTFSRIPNREEAEDIVQNTFLAAHQHSAKFDGRSSAKTWIYAILKNKIADYFRQRFRQTAFVDLSNHNDGIPGEYFDQFGDWDQRYRPSSWQDEPEHLLDNVHFNKVFRQCMDELPPRWQVAVNSKYIDDRDSNEICQELEVSPSNYWQILHRAKLQLRYCLEQLWFKQG